MYTCTELLGIMFAFSLPTPLPLPLPPLSLSSRVFSLFLLPWLETLPKLLVDLGQSSPPLSGFVINSLASAAAHMPLQQLEHHLVSIIGTDYVV